MYYPCNRYYVLELADWVNCIAIDEDDSVILLRHYRHGVRKYLMEFVGGGVEESERPEAAARRELEEEAGYVGGDLYYVGASYPNPANHTNRVHTFLAIGGKIDREQNLEVGETLHVEKARLDTVIKQMSDPNAVYPAIYQAALFHVVHLIRTSENPAIKHLKQYVQRCSDVMYRQ